MINVVAWEAFKIATGIVVAVALVISSLTACALAYDLARGWWAEVRYRLRERARRRRLGLR